MYPISATAKALFDAEQRQRVRITGSALDGTAIAITEANVMQGSFSIDRFSCIGKKLELGTAVSAELVFKILDDGQFADISFEGAELFVEIGVRDWNTAGSTTYWIPCGYFAVDEETRRRNVITITALDRMAAFDRALPTLLPWTDANGTQLTDANGNGLYFSTDVAFPTTVANLISNICSVCGITLAESISARPNANYTITSSPALTSVQAVTFRTYIQWAAALMGACAFIDWNGQLRFKWYTSVSYTSQPSNRYDSDIYKSDITITGLRFKDSDNNEYSVGSESYMLDLSGNGLIQSSPQQVLNALQSSLVGYTYRPFSADVVVAPYLYPLDEITFIDLDGVSHAAAVTNVNIVMNGNTYIRGLGETDKNNSYAALASLTPGQASVINRTAKQARDGLIKLDNSLTQQEIFDRLTDGGLEQALALEPAVENPLSAAGDKKLYLNLDYAMFGHLIADFIMGGTLKLGGYDNINGILQINDEAGNVIGQWDVDGITLSKGKLTGAGSNSWDLSGDEGLSAQSGHIGSFALESGSLSYSNTSGDVGNMSRFDIVPTRSDSHGIWMDYNYINRNLGIRLYTQGLLFYNEGVFCGGIENILISGDYEHSVLSIRAGSSDSSPYLQFRPAATSSSGVDSIVAEKRFRCNDVLSVNNNAYFYYDLTVSGTKSRVVTTDQYSDRLLYCYETPSPLFGDVGEGVIDYDGKCYVWLDAVFAQTITTTQYQVFLQKYGNGDCWVAERKGSYFIVEGTPGMAFGWELKAKQRGFDQRRLERGDEPFAVPVQSYGADAAAHIEGLMKGKVSA